MNSSSASSQNHSLSWLAWGFLGATIFAVAAAYFWTAWFRPQPKLPVYATIGDFSLTNQFGRLISQKDLQGRVWVADVIFTRCPGPCAKMTRKMRELQTRTANLGSAQFVSLTADPEFDTPEVLSKYAAHFQAEAANWHFLTGPKKALYKFAIEDLKFTVLDTGDGEKSLEDRFLHSTQFVLVDQRGRIRGYFDAEEDGSAEKLLEAVKSLLREKGA